MISSNSFPTSSAASLKNFSVGEFFKVSLEQYLLLRCSYLHQSLEETPKSSEKRQQTLEFLNEFMQFGKLVTARPLKHCLTTIADIIERNIILDFSMLRKRGEELSRDVQNRSFKSLLLSFDKMDMHLVQLFARLLCIRLMYERLSQAQKVPKGANYRDKFDNDLNKHIDQIKILSSMSGDSNRGNKDQPTGEDLILQVIKSVLTGCISIELYSFLVSLSNRCELVETKKYIKSEYQALRDRFSKSQKSNLLEGQGVAENIGEEHSKQQQQQQQQQQQCSVGFETSCNNISNNEQQQQQNKNDNSQVNEMTNEDRNNNNNNNNNSTFNTPKQDQLLTPFQSNSKQEDNDKTFLTGSARRRLFTQIFVKKNGDPIIPLKQQQQPLMSLNENNVNNSSRRENSKLSCLQRDSSHSRLIDEENSNNMNSISEIKNNNNNSIVNMNNTNNNENNRHSNNNANNGFGSAHLEENTQFTLLNFKASQQQQQSSQQQLNGSCNNIISNNNNMSNVFLNGRSSLDFRNQRITRSLIFSSQESEKLPNKSIELVSQSQSQTDDFKRLSLASKPSSSSNSTTANVGSTTSALSKALCTSNLRQLTKPIQSGRTMYSQMNKKVLRNSQPKVHHSSSKHNNCTNVSNNASQKKNNNNNNGGEILNNKHNKDTNNILLEAAQLLLLEQDSRKQNQLKLMGRESAHQHDEHPLFNPSSITKKLQNDNGFGDGIIPNKEIHSEEETSLPLMYMWGHN